MECPNWLRCDDARSFFPDVVEELRARGRLGYATVYRVAWFCQVLVLYLRAAEACNRPDGLVDEFLGKGEGADVAMRLPSAEYKILSNALTQLRRLTKELGLDEPTATETGRERLRSSLERAKAIVLN